MSNSAETEKALDAVRASLSTLEVVDERDGVKITRIILEPGEEVPWHRHTEVTVPLTIKTRDPEGEKELQPGDALLTRFG